MPLPEAIELWNLVSRAPGLSTERREHRATLGRLLRGPRLEKALPTGADCEHCWERSTPRRPGPGPRTLQVAPPASPAARGAASTPA